MVVLMAGTAPAQPPVFRRAQLYTLPGSPGSTFYVNVAVGDICSPQLGHPDLVTASSDSRVAVLCGNGDGTFSTGRNLSVNVLPTSILLGDFDNDHVLDLIVSDIQSVEFLKGQNNGSFAAPALHCSVSTDQSCQTAANCPKGETCGGYPAGRGPSALAAEDLDHDGNLDLIVVDDGNGGPGAVAILLGDGKGGFGTPRTFSTGALSVAVALGDFDGDKVTDLAVVNEAENDVTILLGMSGGAFNPAPTIHLDPMGQNPVAIVAQDLNGDHVLDLVIANSNSDNIAVLLGLGNGSFQAPLFFPSGSSGSDPIGLVLADLNFDGHVDAVTANGRSNDASVLLGDGKGNFGAPRSFVTDVQPFAVAAPDLNGDQIADVVTVNGGSQSPNAAVLLGQGDGGLAGVEDVATQPNPSVVIAGDVDNDGVSDLIVAQSGSNTGSLLIYPAAPPAGFALPTVLQSAGDTATIGSGDFNGDGLLDLVALNAKQANVSLFLATPGGKFAAAHNFPIGSGATALVVGDWNGDGRSDLAIARQGSGATGAVDIVLANADGSLGTAKSITAAPNPVAIKSGDFDKDGKRDLVVGNTSGFSIFLGRGDGTFQAGTSVPVSSPGADAIAVADFDHDGADDVAVVRTTMPGFMSPPNIQLFYGDGKGNLSPSAQSVSVNGVPSALVARDFTGDGIPDLLVTDLVNGIAQVFVSSASRTLTAGDTITVSRGPASVAAADFDGDGRYDAAAANNYVAGSISVMTNILAPAVIRGDGNGDGKVTVADAVAVMRELGDGNGTSIEDVRIAGGTYAAAPGIDANGDGLVTPQDALAVAHRLFPRL